MSDTQSNSKSAQWISEVKGRVLRSETRGDLDPFSNRRRPPMWLIDLINERKLTGGFNTRKSNLCNECFEYKSSNGSCACSTE